MRARKSLSSPVFVCCALLLWGCAAEQGNSDMKGAPVPRSPECLTAASYDSPAAQDANYRIQPGDELDISFYLNPEFDDDVVVRPDGKIGLPVVGEINARGSTPAQLAAELDRLYSQELRNPGAVVRVDTSPGRVVYVTGEVGHPGAVQLQSGMTALQAITAAGGMTDNAGVSNVVLLRRDGCGNVHGERLDLGRAMKVKNNTEADAVLLPTDTVIVPRSGIAQIDLIVKQYVRDALPVQPYMSFLPF
jgi:polysaccharide export outer membrane protein